MKGTATLTRKRADWSDAVAAAAEEARKQFPGWTQTGVSLAYVINNGSGWKATLRLEGEVE